MVSGGGARSNVLEIANVRLAVNSNDIAGLILKAEFHFEFLDDGAVSNAFLRVIQVGDTITTTNFVKRWQDEWGKQDYFDILDVIARNPLTPQEIQEGKIKALIPHKPLSCADLIEALQKDGYFDWRWEKTDEKVNDWIHGDGYYCKYKPCADQLLYEHVFHGLKFYLWSFKDI